MKAKDKKFNKFWKWYIKGEYHCDECPYCWGGQYLPGCDEYDDCGCYIKGDIRDTCRLLSPFRFLLGWGKKKRYEYYKEHEYDDYGDWVTKQESSREKYGDSVKVLLFHVNLKSKYTGEDVTLDDVLMNDNAYHAWSDYEDSVHPYVHKTLRKRWKELIRDTWKAFIGIFKPYFCR